MTKKDFQLIADAVKGMNFLSAADKHMVVSDLADALTDSNPRFDRWRFAVACGIACDSAEAKAIRGTA